MPPLALILLLAAQVGAGSTTIQVVDADGLPVPALTVALTGCVAAPGQTGIADARGQVQFQAVTIGADCRATVSGLAGMRPTTVGFTAAADAAPVRVTVELAFSEQVTVTDARGPQLVRETPASLGTISRETITDIAPTHPGQLLGQVAGVWVNTTGGEGHQTAIRQPLTTNPVYLYLEDGVPTRSTGFFNHNALYEVNVPAAAGVEVTKGPGSVLYGSDAIGGVVNVLTRSALDSPAWNLDVEGGQHGWGRLLAGGNLRRGRQGVRVDLNLTRTDGWRDATGYNRQSGTVRWDRAGGNGSTMKALVTFSRVDQQTAGSSALQEDDYLSTPTRNLTPISRRDVTAFRASVDYTRVVGRTVWNVIPYARYDRMGLLANWSLTYDPTDYVTANRSYGVLARVQRDLGSRAALAAGVDLDLSPGYRDEHIVVPSTELTPNGKRVFVSYTDGATVYDYDVTYASVSPYAQIDWSVSPRLRVQTGVRLDASRYSYTDNLDTPATARHQRPANATRHFSRATPKLGLTYHVSDLVSVFASYRDAFRAPSEGQLFRQGTARNTIDLAPVKASNVEGGVRLSKGLTWSADASVYRLTKRDDILSFRDPVTGATEAVNAGETDHLGVELSGTAQVHRLVRVSSAWSYARHRYVDWIVDPRAGTDYSGREMELAPRAIGNAMVTVSPLDWLHTSLEASYIGPYFMDAANTQQYDGHTLVHLRARVRLRPAMALHVRALNLADTRYAESASYTLARGREFAPGAPRTVFVALSMDWTR
jgi:outer membrane receptor protein involved in Fe transport